MKKWFEKREACKARFKETGGGKSLEDVKLLGRWHAIGGGKKAHICECDDPIALAKWAYVWSDLMSTVIYPAVDEDDGARFFS